MGTSHFQWAMMHSVPAPSAPSGGIGTVAGNLANDSFESATWAVTGSNPASLAWVNNGGSPGKAQDEWDLSPSGGRLIWNGTSQDVFTAGKDWRTRTALLGTQRRTALFPYGTSAGNVEVDGSWSTPANPLWARWWLRVPTNFYHPAGGGNNQKLFFFYMDGYSAAGDGSSCGMEFRPQTDYTPADVGSSYFYCKVSSGNYTGAGSDTGIADFISYPDDLGRWMQLCVHIVPETVSDPIGSRTSDGTFKVWRRWENESSWTLTQDLSGQPIRIPTAGPAGFTNVKMMGANNGAYASATDFLIDDFALSTSSLL